MKRNIKRTITAIVAACTIYQVTSTISLCSSDKNIQMIYQVKQGENLQVVAKKFGTSAEKLQRLNGLNDFAVVPGMRLKIDK